jgi:hypothetical protein
MRFQPGQVAEWLNAPVSKTGGASSGSKALRARAQCSARCGSQQADEVAACWSQLQEDDRRLVARIAPELARLLDACASIRNT